MFYHPFQLFGERIVGEPMGESTNANERQRAEKDIAHADQLVDTGRSREGALRYSVPGEQQ
jgi:hypothetical protein